MVQIGQGCDRISGWIAAFKGPRRCEWFGKAHGAPARDRTHDDGGGRRRRHRARRSCTDFRSARGLLVRVLLVRLDALFDDQVDQREDVVIVDGCKGSVQSLGYLVVLINTDTEAAECACHHGEVRVA